MAKRVREAIPASLLCQWQEAVAKESSLIASSPTEKEKINQFNVWRQSCLTACETVDKELERCRSIDTYYSGTTALTVVKQVRLCFFLVIPSITYRRSLFFMCVSECDFTYDTDQRPIA